MLYVTIYEHKSYSWLYSLDIQNQIKPEQIKDLENKIQINPRVALYIGSFDPVHAGHLEAIESALREMQVAAVVVLPNNPNKSKPLRNNPVLRAQMLNLSLANTNQIIVSMLHPEAATKIIQKHAEVIGILGSDQYLQAIAKSKAPRQEVDEWFIVTRTEDIGKISLSKLFFNKPVTFANIDNLKMQKYSSSYIRKFLYDHPDFYLGQEYQYSVLPLQTKLQNFLRENLLYSSILSNIKDKIQEAATKDKIYDIHNDNIQILTPSDNAGKSGALIFVVFDTHHNPYIYVKVQRLNSLEDK